MALYICSADPRAGKTALALALADHYRRKGLTVGYWKPVSVPGDQDGAFATRHLHLAEAPSALAPLAYLASGQRDDAASSLARSLADAQSGKDLLIAEGGRDLGAGEPGGLDARAVLGLMAKAASGSVKALYLARYRDGELLDRILAARLHLGDAFSAVLINAVPADHEWFVAEQVLPALARQGIPVIGVIPQESALGGMTPREVADALGAKLLASSDEPGMDEPFQSIMFGSMDAEDGLAYFGRKQRKLVVSRGDRPDVHMAALGTSINCLLLTGGYPSYPFVLDRAESLGVPVLSVVDDMHSTIDRLDSLLVEARAHNTAKVRLFAGLLAKHVGLSAFDQLLGIPKS